MKQQYLKPSGVEFVALMALLMSLLALAIDAILPALMQIGADLGVNANNPNQSQLLISTVFLGMAVGLIGCGPLSDAYGRKRIIYIGMVIFITGTAVSLIALDFNTMLAGRFIQGFGAASFRVVSIAMIRDNYQGKEMATVMSFITMMFILVPAIAPSIGQGILLVAGWEAIFGFILFVSLSTLTWLHIRLPETLREDSRRAFSISMISSAVRETVTTKVSFGYTLASGLMFGGFVGYLSSAQQLLQIQYQLGTQFSLVFGGLALAIGLSSYANSRLLKRFSMEQLCLISILNVAIASLSFYVYTFSLNTQPSLASLLTYLAFSFFNLGILFGNLNALALNPLGHIAGTATSVIASIQTLLSVFIGGLIGYFYDHSVAPMVIGFGITSLAALAIIFYLKPSGEQQMGY